MPKGGRGPYKKGYRHENSSRRFWSYWFGYFGSGCSRSPMSRGTDIHFFDGLLRRWGVSCKVTKNKVPKWMLNEVEKDDILDIHVDYVGDFVFMHRDKMNELLASATTRELYAPIKVRSE